MAKTVRHGLVAEILLCLAVAAQATGAPVTLTLTGVTVDRRDPYKNVELYPDAASATILWDTSWSGTEYLSAYSYMPTNDQCGTAILFGPLFLSSKPRVDTSELTLSIPRQSSLSQALLHCTDLFLAVATPEPTLTRSGRKVDAFTLDLRSERAIALTALSGLQPPPSLDFSLPIDESPIQLPGLWNGVVVGKFKLQLTSLQVILIPAAACLFGAALGLLSAIRRRSASRSTGVNARFRHQLLDPQQRGAKPATYRKSELGLGNVDRLCLGFHAGARKTDTQPSVEAAAMPQDSDWWPQCAFVRDYFFGGRKKVAHQVADYLAKYYVGDAIAELTPNTDVAQLMSDSIRRFINRDDFTLVRDDDLFADIDFSEHTTFQELVDLIHENRGALRP